MSARSFHMGEQPSRFVLVPWNAQEAMSIAAAAKYLDQSEANVRRLCARYDLGRKLSGSWCVSRVALVMFAEHDTRALRLYHQGDRVSPEVTRYYQRLGLALPASGVAA